jgi:hypothetical protein
MDNAEQLIHQITANPDQFDEHLACELLDEFFGGYPLEHLRALLVDPRENIVVAGIYIASELGAKARPLVNEVVKLLVHPSTVVRFDAIDSLIVCLTAQDDAAIAKVASMLDDPTDSVRWKAMNFLCLVKKELLQAALTHFEKAQPDSIHVAGLRLLVSEGGPPAVSYFEIGRRPPSRPINYARRLLSETGPTAEQALAFIRSDNPMLRKYGAVAAARMCVLNLEPLTIASTHNDEEIKWFADNILRPREVSAENEGTSNR